MFCSNCGANVEEDEKFCYNCGAPLKRNRHREEKRFTDAPAEIVNKLTNTELEGEPSEIPVPEEPMEDIPVSEPAAPEPVKEPEPAKAPEPVVPPVFAKAPERIPEPEPEVSSQTASEKGFDIEQFWKDNLANLINTPAENKYAAPNTYIASFRPFISDKLMEKTLKFICGGKATADDVIGMLTLNLDEKKSKLALGRAGLVVTKYGLYYAGIPGTKEQVKQLAIGGLIYAGVKAAKKEVMAAQLQYTDITDASIEKEYLVVNLKNGKYLKINMGDFFNPGRFRDAIKEIIAHL